jgi:hypothetical protein
MTLLVATWSHVRVVGMVEYTVVPPKMTENDVGGNISVPEKGRKIFQKEIE